MNKAFAAAAALMALLSAACTDRVAGGGTEETNGSLSGVILDAQGKPVKGASVFLRAPDFLNDTGGTASLPDAVTDSAGRFRKEALAPGAYSVEVRGDSGTALLLAADVAAGRSTALPEARLAAGGILEGTMTLPPEGEVGYVLIYGLDRVIRTDSTGYFVATDLPAGTLRTKYVTSSAVLEYPDKETVAITPADTTKAGYIPWLEAYSRWKYSRDLVLQNKDLGLLHDVPNYPLLVRLDSGDIDFAQTDGKDIRIVNSAGRPLNHEIERWNAALKKAEIWVRMEMLHFDTSEQHLKIFWGNPEAANLHSGKRVFADYDGVWHMQSPDCDPGDTVPAAGCRYSESSPTAIPAVGRAANRLGMIGAIARFAGEPLRAPSKPALWPNNKITVSAWFRADTGTAEHMVIATLGDVYGIRLLAAGDLQWYAFADTAWTGAGLPPASSWTRVRTNGLALRDGAWHHAAAVWDGNNVRLYVDGEQAATAPSKQPPAYRLGTQVSIGAPFLAEPSSPFLGDLDEVRFAAEAWSLSRIRADYRFQKSLSRLAAIR